MNPTIAFVTDVSLAVVISMGIVAYVKGQLRSLLVELCGTAERASFWLAFSNVTLVLVPLIFALDYKPEFGPDKTLIFEMATQLKYAMIGFVIALCALALVMLRFIPRTRNNVTIAAPE
jgi:uncharacterized membrane protein YhaH (DUF805 family)